MSEKRNTHSVTILGKPYSLVSDQSPAHIEQTAQMVHDMMLEIKEKAPSLDDQRIAILTALKIASSLLSTQENLSLHEEHIELMVHQINQMLTAQ